MIKAVKFVTVSAPDQDSTLEFFTEKLGFTVATDQPFAGDQRWIELKIPGADTRVVIFNIDRAMDPEGKMTGISFLADDVVKTYEEMSARGVEFVQAPEEQEWGTSAVFKDPAGNIFVLSSR
jgi:catechol 2,3-dioxygenase-like lactoylglutathione lyase family enzyme